LVPAELTDGKVTYTGTYDVCAGAVTDDAGTHA
jgi:hypothetical protein